MKKLVCVVVVCVFVFVLQVLGNHPIGVFVNYDTNSIQFINPRTLEMAGPFLKLQIGKNGGRLLGVCINSDGKAAFVTKTNEKKVLFVDISGGFTGNPKLLGSVALGFIPKAMDCTPNGKYVLVTDGAADSTVSAIDIGKMQPYRIQHLGKEARAIKVTPDGQYVVTVGYDQRMINLYSLSDQVKLSFKEGYYLKYQASNVAISPDGKTVIVLFKDRYIFAIFALENGKLIDKGTKDLPSKGGECCVFSKNGKKTFVLTNSVSMGVGIQTFNVMGPGDVEYSETIRLTIPGVPISNNHVEALGIDTDGRYLYITSPNLSGEGKKITVFDVRTGLEIKHVNLNTDGIPSGIAFGVMD
ncbi:MAG: hypothetical protein ACM3SY_00530 [Candidatus Omnitrophota bacterium]